MGFRMNSERGRGGRIAALVAALLAFSTILGARQAADESGARLAFRVGKVLTMDRRGTVVNNAVVLVEDGRVKSVGKMDAVEIPKGTRVVDRPDLWLVPGFIDGHNHIAGGLRDLNDMVYLTNPGLRTVDTLVPENENVKRARAGGVTTVLLIPGSGTNMSGFGTIAHMAGDDVEEMTVKAPGSLKIAQAGNPERYWYRVGRTFMNYNTRQTLAKAREYHRQWQAFERGSARRSRTSTPSSRTSGASSTASSSCRSTRRSTRSS